MQTDVKARVEGQNWQEKCQLSQAIGVAIRAIIALCPYHKELPIG
jgi:hypothetical protein